MIKIAEIAQELKISEEEIRDCMKGLDGNFIVNDYLTVMGCVFLSRILPQEAAVEFVTSRNVGSGNTGRGNTGNGNTGDFNTGNNNDGDWNTGNYNTGYGNGGVFNTGYYNTGSYNTGSYNTGTDNYGTRNVGRHNIGNGNTGDWNRCDFSTGCFNTVSPQLFFFNHPTDWTYDRWKRSMAYRILDGMPKCQTRWVPLDKMTEEEEKAHPYAVYGGGYLKTDEAMEWWRRLSDQQRGIIMDLPNFDKDIFKAITGIKVD